MSIPDYETLMLPLLRIAGEADGRKPRIAPVVIAAGTTPTARGAGRTTTDAPRADGLVPAGSADGPSVAAGSADGASVAAGPAASRHLTALRTASSERNDNQQSPNTLRAHHCRVTGSSSRAKESRGDTRETPASFSVF